MAWDKQIATWQTKVSFLRTAACQTAAPAGFSLLWDETDKKYGYINNYTGEVTQGKVIIFQFLFYLNNPLLLEEVRDFLKNSEKILYRKFKTLNLL